MVVSSFRGGLVAKRGRSLCPAKRQTLITTSQIYKSSASFLSIYSSEARKSGTNKRPNSIGNIGLTAQPWLDIFVAQKDKRHFGMLPVTDTIPLPLTMSSTFLNLHSECFGVLKRFDTSGKDRMLGV
jgi:hypothetical protein